MAGVTQPAADDGGTRARAAALPPVVVLLGGPSAEHDVSVVSGTAMVLKAVNPSSTLLRARSAKLARHMTDHLDAYLSASQLGITLASLALRWVGEPAFAWIVEPLVRLIPGASDSLVRSASIGAAFFCITALHIVVGEQAPKSFAIRRPDTTSLFIAILLIVDQLRFSGHYRLRLTDMIQNTVSRILR